jgi:hypothetical protein
MPLSTSSTLVERFLILSLLVLFTSACVTDGPEPGDAGFTYQDSIAFMRAASSAWIFAVAPDGNRGPLRELDPEVRRQFVSFVSDPDNFGRPLGLPVEPPEVGIEFRKGGQKFDLFSTRGFTYFYDQFPGLDEGHPQNFFALLEGKQAELAQEWKKNYFPQLVYPVR